MGPFVPGAKIGKNLIPGKSIVNNQDSSPGILKIPINWQFLSFRIIFAQL
jgi:hypothetical protein